MIGRIAEFSLVGLLALMLALSYPVVEQRAAWGTGPAFAAAPASNDGGSGSGQTNNEGGWFGYEPKPHSSPVSVPDPSPLFSYLVGAAGSVLFVRWRRKDKD
jgi:hypothetical protein